MRKMLLTITLLLPIFPLVSFAIGNSIFDFDPTADSVFISSRTILFQMGRFVQHGQTGMSKTIAGTPWCQVVMPNSPQPDTYQRVNAKAEYGIKIQGTTVTISQRGRDARTHIFMNQLNTPLSLGFECTNGRMDGEIVTIDEFLNIFPQDMWWFKDFSLTALIAKGTPVTQLNLPLALSVDQDISFSAGEKGKTFQKGKQTSDLADTTPNCRVDRIGQTRPLTVKSAPVGIFSITIYLDRRVTDQRNAEAVMTHVNFNFSDLTYIETFECSLQGPSVLSLEDIQDSLGGFFSLKPMTKP